MQMPLHSRPAGQRARPGLLAASVLICLAVSPSDAESAESVASAESADSADNSSSTTLATAAVLADLPMLEVAGSPLIHLDLAAAGDPPLPVVLDTGSFHSVAGSSALKQFGGLKRPGDREVYLRRTATGRELTVAHVPGLSPQAEAYPFVRLGLPYLRHYVVELDFAARRVRFLDPEKVSLPKTTEAPDETVIALALNRRPEMDIQVNGNPVHMTIDTSVPVPLWLKTRDLVKSAVSPKTLPLLRLRGERQSTMRVFETDTVKLGGLDAGVFPVIVSQDKHQDAFGINGHVIGIDLLSQFRVRLDIARSRMWLKRESSEPVRFAGLPYSRTRRSGAFMMPFGNWYELFGILPGSPAESLGLEPGDRIDPEQIGVTRMAELLEMIRLQAPLLVHRPTKGHGYQELLVPDAKPPTPPLEAGAGTEQSARR